MARPTSASPAFSGEHSNPDALDALVEQNRIIADLLGKWSEWTRALVDHDDVDVRWKRGSAVKLVLQHLAVREEAKGQVKERLTATGHADLAEQLEGDGPDRRRDIGDLEGITRGHEAMSLNTPEADVAVERIRARLGKEIAAEDGGLITRIVEVLGPSGQRDLPTDRSVRMHSVTRPSPEPRWYDRVGPLRATRAWFDHLRGTPHSFTSPAVDSAREHVPGPEK